MLSTGKETLKNTKQYIYRFLQRFKCRVGALHYALESIPVQLEPNLAQESRTELSTACSHVHIGNGHPTHALQYFVTSELQETDNRNLDWKYHVLFYGPKLYDYIGEVSRRGLGEMSPCDLGFAFFALLKFLKNFITG